MTKFSEFDFKKGWWIAVDSYLGERDQKFNAEESFTEPEYDGVPLKILSVSMPFLCVTNGKSTFGLDTREWGVVRLKPHYVKKFFETKKVSNEHRKYIKKAKIRKKDLDRHSCPKCGGQLIQILRAGEDWKVICKDCGFGDDDSKGNRVLRPR